MEIRTVGARALLLDLASGEEVEAWRAELVRRRGAGDLVADEIVPGARTILVDGVPDLAGLAGALAAWRPEGDLADRADRLVTIPIVYDGPDLDAVAERWGIGPDDVAARHSGLEFRVAFCGFAPGFAYLTGLPHDLAVGRHATPRTRVPAGSVALADRYCGVYPTASPGGWQLIGRTEISLFDVAADPPALLTPGTRVRFEAVSA